MQQCSFAHIGSSDGDQFPDAQTDNADDTLACGSHSGRLEAAVGLHFLFDELLLLPQVTELGRQQLPMAFDPRKSDKTRTKKLKKLKSGTMMSSFSHCFVCLKLPASLKNGNIL